MQSLIRPEVKSAVKHAGLLMANGCANPSQNFVQFAITELRNANMLPANVSLANFSACDYLPHLQHLLFSTETLNTEVTYANLVVLPEALTTRLHEYLGEIDLDGTMVSCHFVLNIITYCKSVISTYK